MEVSDKSSKSNIICMNYDANDRHRVPLAGFALWPAFAFRFRFLVLCCPRHSQCTLSLSVRGCVWVCHCLYTRCSVISWVANKCIFGDLFLLGSYSRHMTHPLFRFFAAAMDLDSLRARFGESEMDHVAIVSQAFLPFVLQRFIIANRIQTFRGPEHDSLTAENVNKLRCVKDSRPKKTFPLISCSPRGATGGHQEEG